MFTSKQKVLTELAILTSIPAALIYIQLYVIEQNGHTPWSVLVFVPWFMLAALRIKKHKLGFGELGFKTAFTEGLIAHTLFAVAGVLLVMLLASILDRGISDNLFSNPHFQYGFLTTAIIQQTILIAYPMNFVRTQFSQKHTELLVGLFFGLIHLPFEEPLLNLLLTLPGGLIFAKLYSRYKNMWLLIAVHAVLNFAFVAHGFISNHNIQF